MGSVSRGAFPECVEGALFVSCLIQLGDDADDTEVLLFWTTTYPLNPAFTN